MSTGPEQDPNAVPAPAQPAGIPAEAAPAIPQEQPILHPDPVQSMAAVAQGTVPAAALPDYRPVQKPVDGQTEIRNVVTRKTYKESGVVTHEEMKDDDLITIGLSVTGVPMAEVGAGVRMTVNLGNFESVQVEVSVTLPCYVEELTECYKAAKHFVDGHLNREVKDIREWKDTKKAPETHGD